MIINRNSWHYKARRKLLYSWYLDCNDVEKALNTVTENEITPSKYREQVFQAILGGWLWRAYPKKKNSRYINFEGTRE